MSRVCEHVLVRVFVDSHWPYKIWHCHRLAKRSFHVAGRQFKLCARCTGMVFGIACCPFALLIPVSVAGYLAAGALITLLLDGTTQLVGVRTSTNPLRFISGLLAGVFCTAFLILRILETLNHA